MLLGCAGATIRGHDRRLPGFPRREEHRVLAPVHPHVGFAGAYRDRGQRIRGDHDDVLTGAFDLGIARHDARSIAGVRSGHSDVHSSGVDPDHLIHAGRGRGDGMFERRR